MSGSPSTRSIMELRHLRVFVTLAEELHFGRTADRLHLTQSSVSGQLRHPEDDLGVQLIRRNARQASLTEVGTEFLRDAQRVLDQADAAARGSSGFRTESAPASGSATSKTPSPNGSRSRCGARRTSSRKRGSSSAPAARRSFSTSCAITFSTSRSSRYRHRSRACASCQSGTSTRLRQFHQTWTVTTCLRSNSSLGVRC
jgi:Bacterial regulatory helix-turn-helix protein, lysR family